MLKLITHKLSILLLCLSGTVLAEEQLLVLTEQLYPMSYTANGQDNEEILGFATELVVAVMTESNLDYQINMVPWARAINSINNNSNVLVFSMSRSPAREARYQWIGEIWPTKINLYGHRDRLGESMLTLEDIKKLRVGTPRGSVTRDYLQSNGFTNIVTVKSMNSYIRLLERGRIDLFPFTDFSINIAANRQNFDQSKLVLVMELTEIPLSLSLAASKTMDAATVQRLKSAFDRVKQSGRYQEIMGPLQKLINEIN